MLFVGTSIIHPSTEGVFLLCNILDLLIYSRELKITKLEYHTIKVGDVCTLYNLVEHLRRNVCYEEKECCFGADTKV